MACNRYFKGITCVYKESLRLPYYISHVISPVSWKQGIVDGRRWFISVATNCCLNSITTVALTSQKINTCATLMQQSLIMVGLLHAIVWQSQLIVWRSLAIIQRLLAIASLILNTPLSQKPYNTSKWMFHIQRHTLLALGLQFIVCTNWH